MIIVSDGPHSKTSRAEIVNLTATTAEDEESLRELYELLHKFKGNEIFISLAESMLESGRVKRICLIVR